MLEQKDEINKLEWDVLVILDACRYDYFEKYYEEYFTGKLCRAHSISKTTGGWLQLTWTDYYDLVYFSATPFVNKINARWETNIWKPTERFKTIIDVWRHRWDKSLGTIHPNEVNKTILDNEELIKGRKIVVHYLQPHGPWIGKTPLPLKNVETLKELNNLELLRRAYRDNLILVMEHVKEMIKPFTEHKIIITSDHGELLGEGGHFLHPGPNDPYSLSITQVVPWLEILK